MHKTSRIPPSSVRQARLLSASFFAFKSLISVSCSVDQLYAEESQRLVAG